MRNAIQEPRAVGVAAAGRIDHALGLDARNVVASRAREDDRALRTLGVDQRLDLAGEVQELAAGLLLEQLALVVVHRDVVGQAQQLAQLFAREHGQALARIEQEWHAVLGALARVLLHALLAVGSDDGKARAQVARDMVLVRASHRRGMEVGDLVVVQIGGDEALGSELTGYALQVLGAYAELDRKSTRLNSSHLVISYAVF